MEYGIKFYLGKDVGWLFLTDHLGNIVRFSTEDSADEYAKRLDFSNNKFIYEVKEIKHETV